MSAPKLQALIAAFLICLMTGIILALTNIPGLSLFPVSFSVFSVSFIVILFILEKLIYKKIFRIHHHLITQFGNAESLAKIRPGGADALEDLSADIHTWLRERKEEVARLNKLENYRKEFLGNVSHELKTPVFNIQGYMLTLLDGGLEDKAVNRLYLQRAEKSVERMISIIEDLESITQLEAGELQLEIERFDVSLLVKEVIDSLEMRAKEKNIKLIMGKYDAAPVWVMGDKFRLRQVFLNLTVNSLKYGKKDGETRINFRDAGEKVMIEVADNGIGMEKKHLSRIFERFYRIDKSRSRDGGGTGLGLSIVEHILEAHGQSISVLSTPGVGTIFSFPLKKG